MLTLLPVPKGMTEGDYYLCPSCIQQPAFDGNAFADAYEEKIVGPAQRALGALTGQPYLTRLFTTISPSEMTEDPEFRRLGKQADVPNQLQAQPRLVCGSKEIMTLPSKREVALDRSTTGRAFSSPWPTWGENMPYAALVEDYSGDGDAIVLADNGAAIDSALAAYNQVRNWPPDTQFSVSPERTDCSYQAGRGRFTVLGALALLAASGLLRRWRRRPK